jgi:hypothetical protein
LVNYTQTKEKEVTKYKAFYYSHPEVEKVEVEKETELSVWIKGRREAKETQCSAFFDTFQEAKDFLIDVFEKKAQTVRRQLERTNGYIGNAKGLKEV